MNARNPIWSDAAHTAIDCEIEHEVYGWIPFTASPFDVAAHGREIFELLSAELVAEYTPPPPLGTETLISIAKVKRQAAYTAEADPLFFKTQRGEATQQDWLDKIAEIKARFPYPEE